MGDEPACLQEIEERIQAQHSSAHPVRAYRRYKTADDADYTVVVVNLVEWQPEELQKSK